MLDMTRVLKSFSTKRPIFHAEADFQQALAWEIREMYPDSKIRLEKKVYGAGRKVFLDILCELSGRTYAIELKYKTQALTGIVDGETFELSNQDAQDTGRYDVLKDIQRLEEMVSSGVADEGILLFLTNDKSYFARPYQEVQTVDRNFRLHEGTILSGKLSWAEGTGLGTMKGRENPIQLKGNYVMKWDDYARLDSTFNNDFRYVMLHVKKEHETHRTMEQLKKDTQPLVTANTLSTTLTSPEWFLSFSQKRLIPTSQKDLTEKLANHLHQLGYQTQLYRVIGKDKIDIWAVKDSETVAIEVRYKTALLQTIYEGNHIHLKNQGANDISRYEFISDLGKIERLVKSRPDVKGYTLLITNDHLYWNQPKKKNTIDEAFYIYDGRVVSGLCSWSERAGRGTTEGREEAIILEGYYEMNWMEYLEVDERKNGEFRALLVRVSN